MSRILRRPMFRGGRVESKGDLKVIDQMGIANLARGGRVGFEHGGFSDTVMKTYEDVESRIPQPKRNKLSTGDYLRIASSGLDILGAPSEGSGISGALRSAAGPLSKLGTDLGSSLDSREAAGVAERQAKVNAITQGTVDMEVASMKSKLRIELQEGFLNAFWDPRIAAEQDEGKRKQLQEGKDKDKYKVIVLGKDISDEYAILKNQLAYSDAQGMAEDQLKADKIEKTDSNYQGLYIQYVGKFLAQIARSIDPKLPGDEGYKQGGRVGRAQGGIMTEDVNTMTETPQGITDVNVEETVDTSQAPQETNEINISYEQLRDRLPPEISDDIVLLLSESYEALADFAEIQTQADVNQFNTKYEVQLFLPQQTGV